MTALMTKATSSDLPSSGPCNLTSVLVLIGWGISSPRSCRFNYISVYQSVVLAHSHQNHWVVVYSGGL